MFNKDINCVVFSKSLFFHVNMCWISVITQAWFLKEQSQKMILTLPVFNIKIFKTSSLKRVVWLKKGKKVATFNPPPQQKKNIFVLPQLIIYIRLIFLAWRLTGVQMNETFVKKRMVHLKYCIEHSKTQSFRSQPQGLSQWMSKIMARFP